MKTKRISLQRPGQAALIVALGATVAGTIALSPSAFAQSPPPPPPSVDYQQPTATTTKGAVAQYLLNPHGDVDGLLLTDNTIVRFPPHLSAQLTATVKPQSAVKIDGYSSVASTIRATSITDVASGKTIVDTPLAAGAPPPPPPDASASTELSASGTIKVLLHAPRGEVDGVILSDGTQVHFAPRNGEEMAKLLVVGQPLAARGNGVTNQFGRSIEATALGTSADALQTLAARPPRGPKGPGRGGPPAPAPDGAPVPPPANPQG